MDYTINTGLSEDALIILLATKNHLYKYSRVIRTNTSKSFEETIPPNGKWAGTAIAFIMAPLSLL
jgi:hypothetical protein